MMRRHVILGIFCMLMSVFGPLRAGAQTYGGILAWGAYNNYGQLNLPASNDSFVAVAAGDMHSLGLKLDGSIVAWGNNGDGQCAVPSPNTGFIAIEAGNRVSLGLKADSTIVVWGFEFYSLTDVPLPNEDFIAFDCYYNHALALKADGSIVAWGNNDYGQCTVPEPNSDFMAVAAGFAHSMGLKSDGTIVTWGRNVWGECDVPSPNEDFTGISCGDAHSLGLKADSTIVGWGHCLSGQCSAPAPNSDFIDISGGQSFSTGLKSDGTIEAWGYNYYGQCDVAEPNGYYLAVSSNLYHSLAVTTAPICEIDLVEVDFDTVYTGSYRDTAFTLSNEGFGSLDGSISETEDQFSIIAGEGPYTLYPGDSLMVIVRFEPSVVGSDTCTVETGTECSQVTLYGYGETPPECSLSRSTLDFGSVTLGGSSAMSFSLKNTGGGHLTGTVSESCGYFGILEGEGPYDLVGGDSVLVTISFEPLTTESAACTIQTGISCGNVICTGAGDRRPAIYMVRDVPGDQGGYLNIAWYAVPGDDPVQHVITRYTVWRAIEMEPEAFLAIDDIPIITRISDIPEPAEPGMTRIGVAAGQTYFWKLVSSIDAYYLEGYSEVVPTLFDSTGACEEYHYVQVIAHSADPYVFWVSPPDSGRSVDNLAPDTPLYFAAEQSYEPEGLSLSWAPNGEDDLEGYAIYRDMSEDFVPGPDNMVASTGDTAYFDSQWSWGAGYFYKLAAVDVHGNESGYALIRPAEVTGGDTPDVPQAFALHQNAPNPFNPSTLIRFDLPEPVHVVLSVFDVRGRLVSTLVDGHMSAGSKELVWTATGGDGRAVSSGVFFYRLVAGEFVQTRKMVLLR